MAPARDWAVRIGTLALLLLVWQQVAQRMSAAILPTPARVGAAAGDLLAGGELASAWGQTAVQVTVAMAVAAVAGVGLGLLFGWYRPLDRFLSPLLGALFLTPRIALVPLIALWFGLQDLAKIVLILAFGFFEVFFTVRDGVRDLERSHVELARAYCVPPGRMLRSVVLPAARPYVLTGLRLGLVHALVGVVLAGFFLETSGIGGLIYNLGAAFRTAELIAALLSVMAVGLAVNVGLRRLEVRLTPWQVAR
ncbi:ABC transporter permease [Streptosporangium roseum]|uniref:Binding-protein-dependent transport systems inner membrane component n=1 Tax=Streptosporangium roseum (strain ATCC 12428 / DSM 43021 / JCM 3005 / KCTC 9067 / NCIMB 10171 / NRRL 2505 / NI 9100) TaxID=479432 RepID=D2BFV2_STRRD|nr:ABC transporter permease subunit [Streptosporangium roseum]ACZ90263.1 binding-protein-dependent transport systems inner membrane component [Streptosporangium roseum DSM 43021]